MIFSEDYLHFFMDLAANNNRDWFHENKKRYQEDVKKPFELFCRQLIPALSEAGMDLGDLEPKDCLFRINRDIRFSKDKSPYKLHYSAVFSKGGKKELSTTGLYVEFSAEHFRLYSGSYMPDKEHLEKLRQKIADNLEYFQEIISDKDFIEEYGEIRGEKNKRIAKEFMQYADEQPLIMNKQFYFFSEMEPTWPIREDLIPQIIQKFEKSKKVREFLSV